MGSQLNIRYLLSLKEHFVQFCSNSFMSEAQK